MGDFLTKHRNIFLVMLLLVTLILSGHHQSNRHLSATVDIPVAQTATATLSATESFRQQRDQSVQADIAALERLIGQEALDDQTRHDAAAQVQEIIDARQLQNTIEGALSTSSLYPCAAFLQGGILSIVTEKTSITARDTALVLSLAADHGGIAPEDVRIICGK